MSSKILANQGRIPNNYYITGAKLATILTSATPVVLGWPLSMYNKSRTVLTLSKSIFNQIRSHSILARKMSTFSINSTYKLNSGYEIPVLGYGVSYISVVWIEGEPRAFYRMLLASISLPSEFILWSIPVKVTSAWATSGIVKLRDDSWSYRNLLNSFMSNQRIGLKAVLRCILSSTNDILRFIKR